MVDKLTKLDVDRTREIKYSFLVALIIANPFLMFLYTKSLLLVSIITVVVLALILFLNLGVKSPGIRVYSINLLLLISIFMGFEVILKFCFPEYIIEDLYTLRNKYLFNKPYLYKNLTEKEYSTFYITNKQGFRIGGINNPEKVIESCDWLFIGDSFTQGAQVDFEELYTSKLYKYYPDKIIINYGVSGLGIGNEYHMFLEMGKILKPKKVFLQICNFNDFMNVEPNTPTFIDYFMSYSDLARFLLFNLVYVQPAELPIGRWTEPFYKSEKENQNYNIFYLDQSPKKKKDIAYFEKYLCLFNNEVKKIGAELIVIQIPTKEQVYFKDFKEVMDNFNINVKKLDMNYPNKLLTRLTNKYGIKLVDVTERFKKEDERLSFEFDEHLNSSGHQLLANCINDVLIQSGEKSRVKLMSHNLYGDRYPQLNKKGDTLVYQSLNQNIMELYLSDTCFTYKTRLTVGNVDEIHPQLSNDGRRIVFTAGNQNKFNSKIEILNRSSGVKDIVTDGYNEFGSIPMFSPDNKFIVYAGWFSEKNDSYSNSKIILYSINDKKKQILIDNQNENWRPAFSPDGSKIAFISKKNSKNDIFLYDMYTKKTIQITNTIYDEWDPYFSPDGKKIIFARNISGNWDLYEIDATGFNEHQITNTKGDEWDPIYSRDGKSIIYAGEFGLFGGIFKKDIN